MRPNIQKDLACVVVAIAPAFIFALIWSIENLGIPVADGGAYFFESFRYYDKFVAPNQKIPFLEGIIKGMWQILVHRPWKPTSFAFFGVPFLLISGGHIGFTLGALAISSITLTVFFAYNLIKIGFNNDRLIATVGAMLLGVSPAVQSYALTNFAETSMLSAIFATLYYMIRSDYLRSKQGSLGFIIALTISITIRPVEVVVALFLPILYFILSGKRKGTFSSKDIFQVSCFAFSAISLLFIAPYVAYFMGFIKGSMFDRTVDFEGVKNSYLGLTILSIAITSILITIFYKKYHPKVPLKSLLHVFSFKNFANEKSFIVPASAIFFLANVIWWAPATHLLHQWTYVTSFGALGQELVYNFKSKFDVINSAVISNGSFMLYALLAAFLIQEIFLKKRIQNIYNKELIINALLIIILPTLLIIFTTQQSSRKLSVAVPFILLILSSFVLLPGAFRKTRIFYVICIIAAQFSALILFHFYDKAFMLRPELSKFTAAIPRPVKHNYNLEVFQYLKKMQKKYGFHLTSILFVKGEFDVFVVGGLTSSSLNKQDFLAGFIYTPEYKEDLYLEAKRRGYDTMLISNPFTNIENPNKYHQELTYYKNCKDFKKCTLGFMGFASGKMLADILLRIHEGSLREANFELLEKTNIGEHEFYLLKII